MSQCTRERDRSNLSISLSSCTRKRYTHGSRKDSRCNKRSKENESTAHLRFQLRLWFFRRARRRAGRTARHRGPVRPCHASRRAASLPRHILAFFSRPRTTMTMERRRSQSRKRRRTRLGQRKGGRHGYRTMTTMMVSLFLSLSLSLFSGGPVVISQSERVIAFVSPKRGKEYKGGSKPNEEEGDFFSNPLPFFVGFRVI